MVINGLSIKILSSLYEIHKNYFLMHVSPIDVIFMT